MNCLQHISTWITSNPPYLISLKLNPSSLLPSYIFPLVNGTIIDWFSNQKNLASVLVISAPTESAFLFSHHSPLVHPVSQQDSHWYPTSCLVILTHPTYHNQNHLLKGKSNKQFYGRYVLGLAQSGQTTSQPTLLPPHVYTLTCQFSQHYAWNHPLPFCTWLIPILLRAFS